MVNRKGGPRSKRASASYCFNCKCRNKHYFLVRLSIQPDLCTSLVPLERHGVKLDAFARLNYRRKNQRTTTCDPFVTQSQDQKGLNDNIYYSPLQNPNSCT